MALVMKQCWVKIRTYHLPDNERMRYVLRHRRGFKCLDEKQSNHIEQRI